MHLDKGCYRGQETVARVHTLGRPPRRLVRAASRRLGRPAARRPATRCCSATARSAALGSVARHYELGPIALGVVKRNVDVDAVLTVDGIPATQEVVVDPEVGLHVRARL